MNHRPPAVLVVLLALSALVFVLVPPVSASWVPNGIRLSAGPRQAQAQQDMISNAPGTYIVVWSEARGTPLQTDIYAQKVNMYGQRRWGPTGVLVCRAPGNQYTPKVVSAAAGGIYVAWVDLRSGLGEDIYAQHVDSTGVATWAADGIPIAADPGADEFDPHVAVGGSGTLIVVWEQQAPLLAPAVYAQKVDATGALLWGPGGVAVSPLSLGQFSPAIRGAGGGVVVVWKDISVDPLGDIVAQYVSSSGTLQWGDDGLSVCAAASTQDSPRIAPHGTYYVAVWQDGRSGIDLDVYAQVIDITTGTTGWGADGVLVIGAVGDQMFPVVEGVGPSIYVAWADFGGPSVDIFAQSLSPVGLPFWGPGGAPICTAVGPQFPYVIVARAVVGIDFAWVDGRAGGSDVYAQRISLGGVPAWPVDGVPVCTAPNGQSSPVLAAVQQFICISWEDPRDPPSRIYAQSLDLDGAPLWAVDGVSVSADADEASPASIPDGMGGMISAWVDDENIRVQRVNASGALQWTSAGAVVCEAVRPQLAPVLAGDGSGGAVVAWVDYRGPEEKIYAQHVAPTGTTTWDADGILVCTGSGARDQLDITSDGAGGAVIAWRDARGADSDIYVQHVSAAGAPLLAINGLALSTATGDQLNPKTTPHGSGGTVVVWEDRRSGDSDIYAHHLTSGGAPDPAWTAGGTPISTRFFFDEDQVQIQEDLVVAWRGPGPDATIIYAQRLDPATGAPLWNLNGVEVSPVLGIQSEPRLIRAAVMTGSPPGAIITWKDDRGADGDIYAQRITSAGARAWGNVGVVVCGAAGEQSKPRLVSDGIGGAVFAWTDARFGDPDLYVQRLAADGTPVFAAGGLAAVAAPSPQTDVSLVSDGVGGGLFSWIDTRDGLLPQTYAMRVAPQGGLYATGVDDAPDAPSQISLAQNVPNPFNPTTSVPFSIPRQSHVRLDILDVQGRRVTGLLDRVLPAGPHFVTWSGRDEAGRKVASGTYFCRLEALGRSLSRRLVLAK